MAKSGHLLAPIANANERWMNKREKNKRMERVGSILSFSKQILVW